MLCVWGSQLYSPLHVAFALCYCRRSSLCCTRPLLCLSSPSLRVSSHPCIFKNLLTNDLSLLVHVFSVPLGTQVCEFRCLDINSCGRVSLFKWVFKIYVCKEVSPVHLMHSSVMRQLGSASWFGAALLLTCRALLHCTRELLRWFWTGCKC